MQSVLKEARDALLSISSNKKQYQALLTDLLVRALCPLPSRAPMPLSTAVCWSFPGYRDEPTYRRPQPSTCN